MTLLDRLFRPNAGDTRITAPAPAPANLAPTVAALPMTMEQHLAQSESNLAQARLGARCLLSNGVEFACIARHVTMIQAEIHTPRELESGTGVVLYLDALGLVHGRINRPVQGGYIVALKVARERRAFFASRLETAQAAANLPDQRAAPRIVPIQRDISVMMLNGREYLGEIADVSRSGIAIKIQPRPGVGCDVNVGQSRRSGVVVRHTSDGVAVQFACPLEESTVTPHLIL